MHEKNREHKIKKKLKVLSRQNDAFVETFVEYNGNDLSYFKRI